ncbi:flagellar basal body-associated protein FliL [Noviherbaspirillum galbum]|uniref:Flagellar protein FliL n=1 Tax=Noviherbaspirillum galbum TaxID=2709383 RepID=A0A6B3SWD1_9BURK|nr:flagellar basal body-associated protein FliL [Noviherbaspirillum galbum]NEX62692.1 flagellar basal body-associated protein FliL [Noviherbaspirillum galbum]
MATKAAPKVVPIEEGAAQPKKSKKKLIIIALAALLVLGGGGAGAWIFLKGSGGEAHDGHEGDEGPAKKTKKKKKADAGKAPVFLAMEQFTVNLQPEVGEQFLQIAFTLQLPDQPQVDMIKQYQPLVRSRLLMLLSSKKASELSTPDGKKKLADEIMAAVNQPFVQDGESQDVSGVFFTSFVIQ